MNERAGLRLLAEDGEDLQIVSAALQDAICKVGDLVYEPRRRRFVAEVNRFRWEGVKKQRQQSYERVRAGLSIEGVLSAQAKKLPRGDKEAVLSLLSLVFEPDDEPPGGRLVLKFAGGGEMALKVECLDVALLDTSRAWPTRRRPDHSKDT